MPEIGTSGLMSGVGKRGGASASVLAPNLDSTVTIDFDDLRSMRRRKWLTPLNGISEKRCSADFAACHFGSPHDMITSECFLLEIYDN